MKALPDKTLEHYCALHPIAMRDPDSPIDVKGMKINPSCIKALYDRGLIEYKYQSINGKSERLILFTQEGLDYGCELLSLVPSGNSKTRKREVLRVYLDMGNEDHEKAWNVARSLAEQRILTPTVVDLFLIHPEFLDPKSKYEILEDAYPAIYKKLQSNPDVQKTMQSLSAMVEAMEDRMSEVLEENKRLRQENERLRQSQSANTGHSSGLPPVSGSTQGIRQIGANTAIAAPVFDDDEDEGLLTVTKDESAGKRASENFLNSLMSLVENKE